MVVSIPKASRPSPPKIKRVMRVIKLRVRSGAKQGRRAAGEDMAETDSSDSVRV